MKTPGVGGAKAKAPKITGRGVKTARKAMLATTAKGGKLSAAAKESQKMRKARAASSDAGLANRGGIGAGKISGKAKSTVQSDKGLKNRKNIGAGKIKPKAGTATRANARKAAGVMNETTGRKGRLTGYAAANALRYMRSRGKSGSGRM